MVLPRTFVALFGCFALMSCGGGEPNQTSQDTRSALFGAAIRAGDVACAGENAGQPDAAHRVVDGACAKKFAANAFPSMSGPPPAKMPDTASRTAHAPLTWPGFLKWIENTYPPLFNGAGITGSVGSLLYRYYPATGYYLGVVDGSALYVMGPATNGTVLGLGTLSSLACFVYPGNCLAVDVPANSTSTSVVSPEAGLVSRVDFEGDQDWVGVDLVAGRSYVFNLQGASSGQGTLADPYLTLYSPQGVQIAANDDVAGTSTLDSRITHTATVTGRHWLAARAYGGVGTYRLTTSLVQTAAAANVEQILWAMGSTTYRNEDRGVVLYMNVTPDRQSVVQRVCSGTPRTCRTETRLVTSSHVANLFGQFRLNTDTLVLEHMLTGQTMAHTSEDPTVFGRATLDPCTSPCFGCSVLPTPSTDTPSAGGGTTDSGGGTGSNGTFDYPTCYSTRTAFTSTGICLDQARVYVRNNCPQAIEAQICFRRANGRTDCGIAGAGPLRPGQEGLYFPCSTPTGYTVDVRSLGSTRPFQGNN